MKILLLEDDLNLCHLIQRELIKSKDVVDVCHDGETALAYALNLDFAYDLAIIDRMLPILDGLTIIKAMRHKGIQIPIIIITGMSLLDDRIEGLDSGADDYLIKPFHIEELQARIRALVRRPFEISFTKVKSYTNLVFNDTNHTLSNGEKTLQLTAREAALLDVFIQNPEHLFSKERLLFKIWGTSSPVELGNVDNYISFLRKRLRELKSECEIITVYGTGYKLEKCHASSTI